MSSEATEAATPRRVGRPARIDRDSIARAVIELGFDHATMKTVAQHLDVSVPGLYYYVRGRDDLLRVAAEYTMARRTLPVDRGQHWADWLREWARHTRESMAQPELMDHYVSGDLNDDRVAEVVGSVLDVLHRDGFEPEAALAAWGAVSSVALGSAVGDLREREAAAAGRPWIAQVHASLARRDPTEHQTLRALVERGVPRDADLVFEERLTGMLIGLAAQHDKPIDDTVRGIAKTTSPASGARAKKR
jgi:AcrR family transcriptional regulator